MILTLREDLTEQQKKSIAQHLEEAVEKAIEKEINGPYGHTWPYGPSMA